MTGSQIARSVTTWPSRSAIWAAMNRNRLKTIFKELYAH